MATATQQSALDQAIETTPQQSRTDLAVLRLENESIMAECRERPRNFAQIKADLADQLEMFPESAMNAIYSKPVGKNRKGEMQFAQGLSIRAAETLAEAYGFNRVRSDVIPIDENTVRVEAVFTDFQRGRIWQDAGVISKKYKGRDGKVRTWDEDRFYNIVVRAEASKRIREAILRCVNSALKAWYESECRKCMGKLLDEDTMNRMVVTFAGVGVDEESLEQLIGKPKKMGWTQKDRLRVLELYNALRDSETTAAELISHLSEKPAAGEEGGESEAEKRAKALAAKKRDVTPEAKKVDASKVEKPKDDEAPQEESWGSALADNLNALLKTAKAQDEFDALRKKYEPMVPPGDEQGFDRLHQMVDDAQNRWVENRDQEKFALDQK